MIPLAKSDVERRIFLAYVAAFAAVLAVAAGCVFFSFRFTLETQADERLDALARNALDQVQVAPGHRIRIETDPSDLAAPPRLFTRGEGVRWFAAGKPIAHAGLEFPAAPLDARHAATSEDSFVLRSLGNVDAGTRLDVQVAESDAGRGLSLRVLGFGLAAGWFVSTIVAGVIGGILGARVFAAIDAVADRQREFVADASHELRGPLTVIQTNISYVLRGPGGFDERTGRALSHVMDAARQMDRLASRLLFLARVETEEKALPGAVDLDERLRSIAQAYAARAADAGIAIDGPLGSAGMVLGDPDDVRRIIENIVENALAYTPSGGLITIEGSSASVTIRDTGVGIAKDELERIFDRFWRADRARARARGGAGLGLAIVRRLLERNGGTIAVESVSGIGSAFTVRFRAAHERQPVTA